MDQQDVKTQLLMFGMVVKDEEFYKRSEDIIEQFRTKEEPKDTRVSDEEKVKVSAEESKDSKSK